MWVLGFLFIKLSWISPNKFWFFSTSIMKGDLLGACSFNCSLIGMLATNEFQPSVSFDYWFLYSKSPCINLQICLLIMRFKLRFLALLLYSSESESLVRYLSLYCKLLSSGIPWPLSRRQITIIASNLLPFSSRFCCFNGVILTISFNWVAYLDSWTELSKMLWSTYCNRRLSRITSKDLNCFYI